MNKISVGELGGYIRDQRNAAQISLRQLAKLAGVSNPYLSQIERGLRRPSAEILQQIAKALRISAEALYVQAGILDERPSGSTVADSVLTDRALTDRQKQVLLEIYDSFRRENQPSPEAPVPAQPVAARARRPVKARPAASPTKPAQPSRRRGAAEPWPAEGGTPNRKPSRRKAG